MKTFFPRGHRRVLAVRPYAACLLTITVLLCLFRPLAAQTQKVKTTAAQPPAVALPTRPAKVSGGKLSVVNPAGTFLISELRTSGPHGLGDDFVELYNNTDSPLTITASDASGGYGLFKMGATCADAPVLIATIPNSTVIPARGHYLLIGSNYSYTGTSAANGDQTMTSDVGSDGNVAIFNTANVNNLSTTTRLDAVGFGSNTGSNCDLLREGTNLPAASGSTLEYSFFRKLTSGTPQDTNDNSADFLFADTQATATPMGQRLGAPGPENKVAPIRRDSTIAIKLLDSTVAHSAQPNDLRDTTPNVCNGGNATGSNCTFGTLSIRRRFQNNTGADIIRLRIRVVDITTAPQAGGTGIADVRAITSSDVSVSNIHDTTTCVDRTSGTASNCTVTAKGFVLEMLPTNTIGGGYNAALDINVASLPGGKLSAGQSVEVQLQLGVMQTGLYRILIITEALP